MSVTTTELPSDAAEQTQQGATIRSLFETILAEYGSLPPRTPIRSDHPLAAPFQALQRLFEAASPVVSRADLRVKWSVGRGGKSKVPWIAFLDQRITTSIREGVYCVYLFRQDLSGLYLTLNQGATGSGSQFYLVPKATLSNLQANARELRSEFSDRGIPGFRLDEDVDLKTDSRLGIGYQAGTVAYKLYRTGALPDVDALLRDLDIVLTAYDEHAGRTLAAKNEPATASAPSQQENQQPGSTTGSGDRVPGVRSVREDTASGISGRISEILDVLHEIRIEIPSPTTVDDVTGARRRGEKRVAESRGIRETTVVDKLFRQLQLASIYEFDQLVLLWLQSGDDSLQRRLEDNVTVRSRDADLRAICVFFDDSEAPSPTSLQDVADSLLLDGASLANVERLLRDKGQVIFYGPPGTGKTYVARQLANFFTRRTERCASCSSTPRTPMRILSRVTGQAWIKASRALTSRRDRSRSWAGLRPLILNTNTSSSLTKSIAEMSPKYSVNCTSCWNTAKSRLHYSTPRVNSRSRQTCGSSEL